MTVKVGLGICLWLFFIGFAFTVFCLKKFRGKGDIHLKSLIFTGTFRNLIGLNPLFPKVDKGGAYNLFLLLVVEHIDD